MDTFVDNSTVSFWICGRWLAGRQNIDAFKRNDEMKKK